MPTGPSDGTPSAAELQARLEAEQATSAHWRRLAEERAGAVAALRGRRSVRALLAAERRTEPLRRPASAAMVRGRALIDRWTLTLAALGHSGSAELDALKDVLDGLPPPAPLDRDVTTIIVGGASGAPPVAPSNDQVHLPGGPGSVARARDALDAAGSALVTVTLGTTEPADGTWLARLAEGVTSDVVAAAPTSVHPVRSWRRATPDDGRVRANGLTVEVTDAGAPVVIGRDHGLPADPLHPVRDIDAGGAAAVLLDATAVRAVGGLPSGDDLDVALLELCTRLREAGGRIVHVPSAVVIDHRDVARRADLVGPVDPDGRAWRAAVERGGPILVRGGERSPATGLRFALTVAAPSDKVATRWGDWHLATALAEALRAAGQEAQVQTLGHADDPAVRSCDVHLVLRGLRPVRRTPGQRHVLWIISHPETVDDPELDAADLVLVASDAFAAHLRERTTTPVEVLLQATDPARFHPVPPQAAHEHDVTIVAKSRDVLRPVIADALAAGLRPSVYGGGWQGLIDPTLIAADHVDNRELPVVYSSAKVVLNDHWETMRGWGFVSNRLFDVLACGTPVISDPVAGLDALFDGAVLEYHSPEDLRRLVDDVLADPAGAHERADRGQQRVLAAHTFEHRAAELLRLLG